VADLEHIYSLYWLGPKDPHVEVILKFTSRQPFIVRSHDTLANALPQTTLSTAKVSMSALF